MKKIVVIILGLISTYSIKAQNERPITTGVPFLLIAADARSAGMGDVGVASSPDAFSQQFNPAKYAFSLKKSGFTASYTPYLTDLVNDISLGQVNYFNRYNERSAFAGSLRYFSLGEIQLTDENANPNGTVKPNEMAIDVSYALQLNQKFSMAVAGRYIRSNLKVNTNTNDASAANSFAVDVAGFYQSEEMAFTSFNGRYRLGFNLQNLGPKISYDADIERSSNFLPSNLKLGGGFDFIFDDYNKVAVNLEFNKLLVPTPQKLIDVNGNGFIDAGESQEAANEYNSVGWTSGIFKSFGDAPDGFSEELKEVNYGAGLEYWYQDSFAFRTGYFNESKEKGARKFATLGAGFKYSAITLDVSYLFSISKIKNPLENTLRFSLTFNFGDDYDQY
ncbi:type IX secretion system outer membrane channel protein PorV [Flavobacterium amnicola]|uniref:Type IX secretion system outer membrane channel protein PorV n=1 Tax=Flavobacterium amnicola TaxID=2506422 RepID=A0A4Q1K1S8_9FLAO|nr:type IX secretion system outer membrane channel protein PorV [Flavobacterium amnicola]RXR17884.1 type IX secretion system outer membrane channel protein PorV [Flavobacterium amnicola]